MFFFYCFSLFPYSSCFYLIVRFRRGSPKILTVEAYHFISSQNDQWLYKYISEALCGGSILLLSKAVMILM